MIPFKPKSIILAPMAGITDKGFRRTCIKYGADGCVSEMVSAKGVFYGDNKSKKLLEFSNEELPISLQIFGNDTISLKFATEYITENLSPSSIDINMGCPAPKIFQNGDGCALMRDLKLSSEIIKVVKQNTNLPVSVKFRSGVNEKEMNAVEFAKMCEYSGADFITVHPRTREQFYSGKSDIEITKKVVESVSIPVIASGDITDGKSAKQMFEYTGVHSIMIARAALGNPLIFSQIKNYLSENNEQIKIKKYGIALEHLKYVIEDKGETTAVKEFRKHLLWYVKGTKGAAKLKEECSKVSSYSDCEKIITKIVE